VSYDVWIGDKSFNYTSNTRMLIYDHIHDQGNGGGLHEIADKTGREAALILGKAFMEMNTTRHWAGVRFGGMTVSECAQDFRPGEPWMTAKYDCPSGWGSTIGTILFLGQILAACAEFPDEIVGVST